MSPRRETVLVPEVEPRSYYDQPILKEPVWKWEIPTYLFTGGLAAGSALVAAASGLAGDEVLAARMEQAALAAVGVSGALLVADLGRPSRFHHMLRVLKPTSPMNIGAWLLGAFGGSVASAVVADLCTDHGRVAGAARLAAAAIAPMIASYTAVLLADTAIPAWHDARAQMPFVFVGGAAASAGGLALLVAPPEEQAGIRACLVGGAALELGALRVMKLRLDRSNAGGVYHDGRVRTMNRTAELATTAGVVLTLAGRRHRILALAGGMLTLVGALAERFAIVDAGRASARDPAAVVAPQLRRSGSAPGPGPDRYSGLGRLAPG